MRALTTCALACFVVLAANSPQTTAQEAPKKTAASSEWYKVGTVMQLDLLPKEARLLEATRGDAEFLEFVAEVPQLEALRFSREVELSKASLKALGGADQLQMLDLSGALMAFELSNELIEPMRGLKVLRIDLSVDNFAWCGTDGRSEEEREIGNANALRQALAWSAKFRERGGRIEIGRLTVLASMIPGLREELPEMDSTTLVYGDDASLRELAKFGNLERLGIEGGAITELGFACLARCATMKSLAIREIEMGPEVLHHLAKFKSLSKLEISGCSCSFKAAEFQRLFNFKPVKDLVIDGQLWNEVQALNEQELANLGGATLDSLCVSGEPLGNSSLAAGLGFYVAARRLEIKLYGLDAVEVPEIAAGQARPRLEELVLHLSSESGDNLAERAKRAADMLARYPSLKRLSIWVESPDASFDAAACQKELKAALPKAEISVR